MPLLVAISFAHYSPKDSKEGIKGYVVADTIDEAVEYINKEYRYGELLKETEEISVSISERWRNKHPTKIEEAKALGLQVEEDFRYVSGPKNEITLWFGGEDFDDNIQDAYYGVTQYSWRDQQEITPQEAEILLRLKIAIKLPNE